MLSCVYSQSRISFASAGTEGIQGADLSALAHPTRIAVVESLRSGERGAGALLAELGLEQANLSQYLAVLRARQVVLTRKAGNQVYYRLRDPVLTRVLDLLKRYFYAQISGSVALLDEMELDKGRRRRRA